MVYREGGLFFTLNLRAPGQYYDAETHTHYNYFRDYNPKTGRYLTRDPIGLKGGLNSYAYANNNPNRFIDPLGLVGYWGGQPNEQPSFLEFTSLAGDAFIQNSDTLINGMSNIEKPSPELQSFLSDPDAMATMSDVMVSIASMQTAAGYAENLATGSNPVGWFIKLGMKAFTNKKLGTMAANAAMGGYLAYEYGDEAKSLFEKLVEVSELINALEDVSGCDKASYMDDIEEKLAAAMTDFIKEAGLGKFKKVMNALNFKKKKKKDDNDKYQGCSGKYKYGTRPNGKPINLPRCSKTSGTWGDINNTGKQGDSLFIPHKKGTSSDYSKLRKALDAYGQKGIKYKSGYPVLDNYRYKVNGYPADVNIGEFTIPRNDSKDFSAADEQYRKLIGDSDWERPSNQVWHHHQEQGRMQLIDKKIHNNLPHCGGVGCYN